MFLFFISFFKKKIIWSFSSHFFHRLEFSKFRFCIVRNWGEVKNGIIRHRLWKLIQDFYFCSIYDARPVEKRGHIFLERSYTRVSEAKRESSFVLKKLVWPCFSTGQVYCKLNKNKNPRLKFLQTMTYHILYQSFP